MKTLTLDLNKLSRAELEAYLMLHDKAIQVKIKEENKGWIPPEEPLPKEYPSEQVGEEIKHAI